MWNYEDIENLINNITVRKEYKDDIHRTTRLIPHKGYKVHFKEDIGYMDDEGIFHQPTYEDLIITDSQADINKYEAVSIEEIEVVEEVENE